MDAGSYETIKGKRFALWKGEPSSTGVGRPRWPTIVGTGLFTYAIFLGSAFIVRHPEVLSPWLGVSSMVFIYGSMFVVLALRRRMRRRGGAGARQQEGPKGSFPAIVRRTSCGSDLGRTPGWLWTDGAWLRFRGDQFAFDLRREDLGGKRPPRVRPGYLTRLTLPTGLPELCIGVRGCTGLDCEARADPSADRLIESALAEWWRRPPVSGQSLFPPITYNVERTSLLVSLRDWAPLGLVVGLSWAMNVPLFPAGSLTPRVVWLTPVMAMFVALSVPFTYALLELTAWSHERKLRRARGM